MLQLLGAPLPISLPGLAPKPYWETFVPDALTWRSTFKTLRRACSELNNNVNFHDYWTSFHWRQLPRSGINWPTEIKKKSLLCAILDFASVYSAHISAWQTMIGINSAKSAKRWIIQQFQSANVWCPKFLNFPGVRGISRWLRTLAYAYWPTDRRRTRAGNWRWRVPNQRGIPRTPMLCWRLRWIQWDSESGVLQRTQCTAACDTRCNQYLAICRFVNIYRSCWRKTVDAFDLFDLNYLQWNLQL